MGEVKSKIQLLTNFWGGQVDRFLSRSFGYCMLCEGEVASVCYGVFPGGNQYEAHVKTLSGFGERGYAKLVATAYVLHCVENQFQGVWCCDHDHRASCRIARSVGFVPTGVCTIFE